MAETKVPVNLSKDVEELRRRRASDEAEAQGKADRLNKETEALRARVEKGEATTGDRITDYFLVTSRTLDGGTSKAFREIETQMLGKKGELFLVIRREKARARFCGPGEARESDYYVKAGHFIGLLENEQIFLDFKKAASGLSTEKYFDLSGRGHGAGTTGPFLFSNYELHEFIRGKQIGFSSGPAFELVVGDTAVLNYSPYSGTSRESKVDQEWVVKRNKAIRSLGKDIPEAPEEKAFLEEHRNKTLIDLDKVRARYRFLLDQKPHTRGEIDNCEAELRALLDRALNLKLGEEPLVQLVEKDLASVTQS